MGYKANFSEVNWENSLTIISRDISVMPFFKHMIKLFYSLKHKSKVQLSIEFRSFSPNNFQKDSDYEWLL